VRGFITLCILMLIYGCGTPPPVPVVLNGQTMGTTWTARYYSDAPETLEARIQERLADLDARLSTYRSDSEVSRFNDHNGTDWFPVSADTLAIVKAAQTISEVSGGAFDITVGPLVDLWGFGPGPWLKTPPNDALISERLAYVGFRLIETRDEPPALRKRDKRTRIDLSAIAKGYGVDLVAGALDAAGLDAWLAEVGGELRTRGTKPGGQSWQVAIEKPVADSRSVHKVIPLKDKAIATSGDYRNFFEWGGTRYSHSIDPRNGWPVQSNVASVSVIADTAMTADAWATALLIMPPDEAATMAAKYNLATSMIVRDANGELIEKENALFVALTE